MKKLTVIEVILTMLVVITVMAMFRTAAWINSMQESNPERILWQPRFSHIFNILWPATAIPWVIFTVIYVIILFLYLGSKVFSKLTNSDKS